MKVSAVLILAVFAVCSNSVHAAGDIKQSPVLIELFTSEGCSSCPPADALLQQMETDQAVRGAELIVLSEHVTYWNHDGWKDPYSSSSLTDRQSAYARALGRSDVYTPQMIANGTGELMLNDAQQMDRILRNAAASSVVPVRIDSAAIEGDNPPVLRARIEADGQRAKTRSDVYVAVALNHAESQVLHGENSGRHLTHIAVVQTLKKIGSLQPGDKLSRDLQLKLKPGTDRANTRIIAFVQEPGPGGVLGAALQKAPLH